MGLLEGQEEAMHTQRWTTMGEDKYILTYREARYRYLEQAHT